MKGKIKLYGVLCSYPNKTEQQQKENIQESNNKGSFGIPFSEKKLVDKEKTQEEMEEGAHFCMHTLHLFGYFPTSSSGLQILTLVSWCLLLPSDDFRAAM